MQNRIDSKNKFHFVSLGCARNLVDSEVMIGILLKAGFEITSNMKEADYLVVNTCGFLEASRQEGIDTIDELFREKKADAKVIVAGCMVQKYGADLQARFPKIHYLLGSGDVEKILDAVQTEEQGTCITSARSYLEWGEVPRTLSTPKHYAYLKIAEGCRKRCAFCIIPTIKGPLQSKPVEQVIKEFRSLLAQGVFEVILIAQDLGDFGKDRKEKGALVNLLKQMLQVEGDYWLRLLYLYPDEIDQELIDLIKSDPRICPYLDMPIQHINDEMLRAMHRTTSREQIIGTIRSLREQIPDIVIRTSLMVGFPGETEAQFEEMLEFVQTGSLDNVGIFTFSLEKEAYAACLPNQISEEVKQARFERLAAAQLKMVRKRNKQLIGQQVEAIVEGFHPSSELLLQARTRGQCPEIDGHIIVNDPRAVKSFGKLYKIEITQVSDYDLIGTALGPVKKTCKSKLVLI